MGGTTSTEGRVEICIDETWGTICDDQWSTVDAQVACRSLGLSSIGMCVWEEEYQVSCFKKNSPNETKQS